MSTVRVYKSTDPGAPPHPSALRGSMAALLRACLVTGYGSGDDAKASAGWEEPFTESGNYAVFRALTGARQFFQIDDNQADADVTAVRAFESMVDVTGGGGLWLASSPTNCYFGKRYSGSDTYSTSWLVIADEVTCYVFLNSVNGFVAHGFGEYQSYLDDNPYNSFFAGHNYNAGLPSSASEQVAIGLVRELGYGGILFLHRDISLGSVAAVGLVPLAGVNTNNPGGAGFVSASTYPGRSYPVCPLEIGGGAKSVVGGRLRGLYAPLANRPKTHLETFSHDGKTFMAVNYANHSNAGWYGQFWVDITGSWA